VSVSSATQCNVHVTLFHASCSDASRAHASHLRSSLRNPSSFVIR
jgi:hypothetical protein